jgi:very-short-patch-repair endonuclease
MTLSNVDREFLRPFFMVSSQEEADAVSGKLIATIKERHPVFDAILKACESPIEINLALAFFQLAYDEPELPVFFYSPDEPPVFKSGLHVQPQFPVGRYRLDFLVVMAGKDINPPLLFAVECDGHEFHERTPQQAARDKQRDRTLTKHGLRVMRFTGSEINRDPDHCVRELLDATIKIRGAS